LNRGAQFGSLELAGGPGGGMLALGKIARATPGVTDKAQKKAGRKVFPSQGGGDKTRGHLGKGGERPDGSRQQEKKNEGNLGGGEEGTWQKTN